MIKFPYFESTLSSNWDLWELSARKIFIFQLVITLFDSLYSKDFIRKKALICLEQIALKNPDLVENVMELVIVSLSDKDPGVAIVAIQVINSLYSNYTTIDLTSCLKPMCEVQHQILDNRLPKDYQFRGLPAPWAQQTILR